MSMTKELESLNLPVGYRFDPRDDQVCVYLECQIFNKEPPTSTITITLQDPYSQSPEELPLAPCKLFKKNEWWFFAERPDCDSIDKNLMTAEGYYLCTSGDIEILEGTKSVGFKRKYSYFTGTPPEEAQTPKQNQTRWSIYEYRLNPDKFSNNIDSMIHQKILRTVICKVAFEQPKNSSQGSNQPAA